MNEFTRKALALADALTMCKALEQDSAHRGTYAEYDADREKTALARSALLAHLEGGELCEWTLDEDPDFTAWNSACGEAWSFNDGGPAENRIRFCQGCGKPVKILPATPTEESP